MTTSGAPELLNRAREATSLEFFPGRVDNATGLVPRRKPTHARKPRSEPLPDRQRRSEGNELVLEVETDHEEDGRWFAIIPAMPGVMSYGRTAEKAVVAAEALALEVAADSLRHGESIPEPLQRVFRAK